MKHLNKNYLSEQLRRIIDELKQETKLTDSSECNEILSKILLAEEELRVWNLDKTLNTIADIDLDLIHIIQNMTGLINEVMWKLEKLKQNSENLESLTFDSKTKLHELNKTL